MDINQVVNITRRAWSFEILALLISGVPGRQAPLLAASKASRTAFLQSLSHLIEVGMLEKNPGHGHPLRPEYRLTASGYEIAKIAVKVNALASKNNSDAILRKNWTIPILTLSQQPHHFSDYKIELPQITDRALSQSLRRLHAHNWLERQIDPDQYPPRPFYKAINEGRNIGETIRLAL